MAKASKQRTPDPDEPQVPKNAVPKKVPVKPKKAPPQPKKLTGVPFQPTSLLPITEAAVLSNMMSDFIRQGGKPESPHKSIQTLDDLIAGVAGGDIQAVKEEVMRLAANRVEKAALVESVLQEISYVRMLRHVQMRDASERVLHAATLSGDMKTDQAYAIYQMSQAAITEERKALGNAKPVDAVTIINKVDISHHAQDTQTQERWQNTTPQGREIIRKKLYDLETKVKSAKATGQPSP